MAKAGYLDELACRVSSRQRGILESGADPVVGGSCLNTLKR